MAQPTQGDPLAQISGEFNKWSRQNVDPLVRSINDSPLNPFRAPAAAAHPAAQGSKFTFLDPARPGEYNIPSWLLFVKTEGAKFGLGRFSNDISLKVQNGQIIASVADPALLREIAALRENPQLARQMETAYTRDHHNAFPAVVYAGANTKPDAATVQDQKALMTLGFDIGVNRPDGIRGPLTDASYKEFAELSKPPVAPAALHGALQAAAHQAQADAARYTKAGARGVTPAIAFSMKNGANGADMNLNMLMQIAQHETAGTFDPAIKPVVGSAYTDKHHQFHPAKIGAAQGLFQFEPQTWLSELQRNGAKYGLGRLASEIKGTNGDLRIDDPATAAYAMNLRADPRLNAALGGELYKECQRIVAAHDPSMKDNTTAVYAVGFLGATDGGTFISGMKSNPGAQAADAMHSTKVAQQNHGAFFNGGVARSFRELWNLIESELSSHAFGPAGNQGGPLVAKARPPARGGTPS